MLNKGSILSGLFFILIIQTHVHLSARSEDDFILLEASLYTISGDTIVGKIKYVNHYNIQFNLPIVDTGGNVIAYYSPKELKGFSYTLLDENYNFISKDNPAGVGKVFLRLLYDGRFSVFQFLELNTKSNYYSFITKYYLWNSDWLEPPITHEFEKQSLLYHFASCPELEYKIKTGEYAFPQIRKIIDEYDACNLTDDYEYFYE